MIERLRYKEQAARSVARNNCYDLRRFLENVLDPTFVAITSRMKSEQALLSASEDILDAAKALILRATNSSMLKDMGVAFALSIQSIWERGFRDYVATCAHEIPDQEAAKRAKANRWPDVLEGFELVQGLSLNAYPEAIELSVLHSIGNVCRHGPGPSLNKLMNTNPEFWPEGVNTSYPTGPMQGLCISHERLRGFVIAATSFWSAIDNSLYSQQYSDEERAAHARRDAAFNSVDIEVHRDKLRKALIEQFMPQANNRDGSTG